MLCPYCGFQIPEMWGLLKIPSKELGKFTSPIGIKIVNSNKSRTVTVDVFWATCPNNACREVLVKVVRQENIKQRRSSNHPWKEDTHKNSWFAVPKKPSLPPVDESIAKRYKQDYLEACSILADSPRMSAVLSGKIIADLLKEYCNYEDYKLSTRIKRFIEDESHPSTLKKDLEYGREIRNFSTHTIADEESNIVEVGKEEAEWALEIVADLFNYLIVEPARSKKRREAFDRKIEKAGRKPISESG